MKTRVGSRFTLGAIALGLAVLLLGPVALAAGTDPHVTQVIGATSDAYEAAAVGSETWIATSGGLAIVKDGRLARVVGSKDGLPGSRLRSISVLPEGAWVGGVDGAALVVREKGGEPRVARTVPLARVRRVALFAGQRWVATFGAGLHRMDGRFRLTRVASVASRASVTDLVVHRGRLYVALAGEGILRLDARGRIERRWRVRDGLADDVVWDLESAEGARLLAATANGISVLDGDAVQRDAREARASRGLEVTDVRAVLSLPDATWVATQGGGLRRLSPAGTTNVGPWPTIRSVARIGESIVVLHPDGAHRVGAGEPAALLTGGLPSGDVSALAAGEGDRLWIGAFDRGLARVDGNEVRAVSGVDPRVNDLAIVRAADGRERLFVATDGGLFAGDDTSFAPVDGAGAPPREHVSALHVDPRTGDLWTAGAQTLARRTPDGTWTRWPSRQGDLPSQLDAVTVDASGRVWLGSLHGLVRFDPSAGRSEIHRVAGGELPVDWVTACAPWQGGVVAGTYNGGLAFIGAKDPHIEREADGLPSGWTNPHAMRVIAGVLWIGALDGGLLIGAPGAWRHLGLADGLPSADVTAIEPTSEGAWVATRAGIAKVAGAR